MTAIDLAANLSGLIGGLLLLVPRWHVAKYGYKAARLTEIRDRFDARLQQQLEQTKSDLERIRDSWSRGKTTALVFGTVLSVLSYAIPFLSLALANLG